jgi:hypothetical protein
VPGYDVRAIRARVREHFDGSPLKFIQWIDRALAYGKTAPRPRWPSGRTDTPEPIGDRLRAHAAKLRDYADTHECTRVTPAKTTQLNAPETAGRRSSVDTPASPVAWVSHPLDHLQRHHRGTTVSAYALTVLCAWPVAGGGERLPTAATTWAVALPGKLVRTCGLPSLAVRARIMSSFVACRVVSTGKPGRPATRSSRAVGCGESFGLGERSTVPVELPEPQRRPQPRTAVRFHTANGTSVGHVEPLDNLMTPSPMNPVSSTPDFSPLTPSRGLEPLFRRFLIGSFFTSGRRS